MAASGYSTNFIPLPANINGSPVPLDRGCLLMLYLPQAVNIQVRLRLKVAAMLSKAVIDAGVHKCQSARKAIKHSTGRDRSK